MNLKNTMSQLNFANHYFLFCCCLFFVFRKKVSTYRSSIVTRMASAQYYMAWVIISDFITQAKGRRLGSFEDAE